MGGRREHLNIDTTTCDPIVSMSKEKIDLKMRFFSTKTKTHRWDWFLAQKDLIQREFGPLTVAKVQKDGFHGCQRLSKSRLRAMTRWCSLQGFSHKKHLKQAQNRRIWREDLFFIGGIGPRSHPQL